MTSERANEILIILDELSTELFKAKYTAIANKLDDVCDALYNKLEDEGTLES